MKRTLLMLTLAAAVLALPASAQFRYGFQGGCALKQFQSYTYNESDYLSISNLAFALRGEYGPSEGFGAFTAPAIIIDNTLYGLEIPVGLKYRLEGNAASPFFTGGVTAGFRLRDVNPVDRFPDRHEAELSAGVASHTGETADVFLFLGTGVELGSFENTVFIAELQYKYHTSPADPHYLSGATGADEVTLMLGFLFR